MEADEELPPTPHHPPAGPPCLPASFPSARSLSTHHTTPFVSLHFLLILGPSGGRDLCAPGRTARLSPLNRQVFVCHSHASPPAALAALSPARACPPARVLWVTWRAPTPIINHPGSGPGRKLGIGAGAAAARPHPSARDPRSARFF